MREYYNNIREGREVRPSLAQLKGLLKTAENRARFRSICGGNYDPILKCLASEDAKVRKNAAGVIGLLGDQENADLLMDAWRAEETRFVRPAYLSALSQMDCSAYMEEFHARLDWLESYSAPEEEKKHAAEETAALRDLILRQEGLPKHKFTGWHAQQDVVLTARPAFRAALFSELRAKKREVSLGVRIRTGDLGGVFRNRVWQEMLFVVSCSKKLPMEERALAGELAASNLLALLEANHSGEPPFYFRIGFAGPSVPEDRGAFIRSLGSLLEGALGGKLVNSASHYEAEIRLVCGRDGTCIPFLKLFTIADQRFSYRRYYVPASMKPATAAGIAALARPYCRPDAAVLDPFCGVGTLLIERQYAMSVRRACGIDTFGEAVAKARANTERAGQEIQYLNRNFFHFECMEPFDEIFTDMPAGNLKKEELELIYRVFLEKSYEVLAEGGRVFCYSGEMGLLKKYLRLNGGFRLVKEFEISRTGPNPENGMWLFILEKIKKSVPESEYPVNGVSRADLGTGCHAEKSEENKNRARKE